MENKNSIGLRLGKFVVGNRWKVFIITTLILAGCLGGMKNLSFSSDVRIFFGEDNPQLAELDAMEHRFTKSDILIFAIESKKGDVFTADGLSIVTDVTDAGWQMPYSSRVDSISNYQHTEAVGDELVVADLFKHPAKLTDEAIKKIKRIATSEEQLLHRVINPDGSVTAVVVTFRMPEENGLAYKEIVTVARKLAKKVEANHPDFAVYLSGGIMIDNAFAESSENDMKTIIPMMLMAMLLVIWFSLRSIIGMGITTMVIFFSALSAIGIAGWIGMMLTPPSANAPTIILTLAVADSVHILVTMLHEMQMGKSRHNAIIESMRVNLQPVFLTSATTAVGFLALNSSDSPPFQDLGNLVAIGVIAAFFFSVTLLPALAAILPITGSGKQDSSESALVDGFADMLIKKRKQVLYIVTAVILLLLAGTAKLDLNDLYLTYFDKSIKFRTDTDFIEKNLTGMTVLEYTLSADGEGGISAPEYLDAMERFSAWLKQQPEVMQTVGTNDIMKRLNRSMHGDDDSYRRIPESRELAAQYLLLYEMSLPFGLDLNNMINVDKSATKFTVVLHNVMNRETREFSQKASGWLKKNAPAYMQADASGISVVFAYINERNVQSMLTGTFLALIIISGILIFALRSVKVGIISLVPNLVPALMTFGLWGFTVSQVGLAVSILAAMSLGIVVDDTVHFLSKYVRARREHGMSSEEAVRYSFHTVGRALVVTSVVLIIGFALLSTSGFKLNHNMGMMTAIAITFALFIDFTLLPTLLMKFDKDKKGAA